MKDRNFLAVSAICLLFLMSFMTANAVYAQGHAGHTMPPPAAEKQKTVKPQAPQPAPPEEMTEETPQVDISSEQQQLIGVKTVKASLKPIPKVIRTVGRIEADERKQATINTKVEGWIEKLHVDYTGRYVKKGDPLVEIYSPELLATQQEFLGILKWAKQPDDKKKDDTLSLMLAKDADAALDAARQRLRLWDISEEQIKQIQQSGKPVRTLTLYSPVSGFVTQKMAVQGMKVMPGEKLFDIADLSTLWIIADIYEYEMPFVKVGQPAKITLSYFPGKELSSKIDYIYPTIAADTRTAKIRLMIPNPGGQLKPQMFTNVEIRISLGQKLVVPESAVIDTGTSQVVYVDKGEGAFEPREVELGLRADGLVEVLRGIKAGEKVASSANFLIDSEAQLKGIKPLRRK
ncbi:MAG: efflux RND transporter periplasmic adaptor subunit [Deltaproteobacteria bacterium HGW-Deltaproteobacteria-2]|jgi:Cu(I)/Ag(I) efflux system membrane fusion protein|nr:MAG: efflux RND transporter periplasmic adaptor subunit [Deltaproteobacteria bacterium HGW-Deltaproteobacteria-2]